jgi:hypothetical protein
MAQEERDHPLHLITVLSRASENVIVPARFRRLSVFGWLIVAHPSLQTILSRLKFD